LEMVDALTGAAQRSRNMGISIEETAGTLMAFHSVLVRGKTAGTQYEMMLRDIAAKFVENEAAWEAMGIAVFDVAGELRPIFDILKDFEDRFASLSDKQKTLAGQLLGLPSRSERATRNLLGFSEEIRKMTEHLRNSSGAIQEMVDFRMQSFSTQMAIARAHLTALAFTIGGQLTPHLITLTSYLQGVFTWFTSLSSAIQQNVIWYSLLAIVIPPILILLSSLVQIITFVGTLFIAALSNPISAGLMLVVVLGYIAFRLEGINYQLDRMLTLLYVLSPQIFIMKKIFELLNQQVSQVEDSIQQMMDSLNKELLKAQMTGKQKSLIYDMIIGGKGGLTREAKEQVIADALSSQIISDFEAKGLMDILKGETLKEETKKSTKEMFDLQSQLMEGMLGLEQQDETRQKTPAQLRGFGATEFGTEEEFRARVSGQQQLLKSTDKMLQEEKKTANNTGRMQRTLNLMKQLMENQQGLVAAGI
jgi:hypothetical protein